MKTSVLPEKSGEPAASLSILLRGRMASHVGVVRGTDSSLEEAASNGGRPIQPPAQSRRRSGIFLKRNSTPSAALPNTTAVVGQEVSEATSTQGHEETQQHQISEGHSQLHVLEKKVLAAARWKTIPRISPTGAMRPLHLFDIARLALHHHRLDAKSTGGGKDHEADSKQAGCGKCAECARHAPCRHATGKPTPTLPSRASSRPGDRDRELRSFHYKGGKGRYTGQWRQSMPHGQGAFKGANGVRYRGRWEAGYPNGPGILQLPDGKVYDGTMVSGVPQGFGVMYDPYGASFIGTWADGRPSVSSNDGQYRLADGTTYFGTWQSGKWELCYGWKTSKHSGKQKKKPKEETRGNRLDAKLCVDHKAVLSDEAIELDGQPVGTGMRLRGDSNVAGSLGETEHDLLLHEVLENPNLRTCLVKYVRRTFQTENLSFLLRFKVLQHVHLKNNVEAQRMAVDEIVEDFVAPGAPFEINIPGDMRKQIMAGVAEKKEGVDLLHVLLPAAEEILRILEYDVWCKFILSQEFEDCLELDKDAPPSGDVFSSPDELFDFCFVEEEERAAPSQWDNKTSPLSNASAAAAAAAAVLAAKAATTPMHRTTSATSATSSVVVSASSAPASGPIIEPPSASPPMNVAPTNPPSSNKTPLPLIRRLSDPAGSKQRLQK